jgi:hypothetical protein
MAATPDLDRRRLALLGAALFGGGGVLAGATEALAKGGGHKLTITIDGTARNFDLPDTIDGARVKRDCEILAQLIAEKPELIPAIYRSAVAGEPGAERKFVAAGLTEEAFVAQGGGLFHLLLLLAVGAYAAYKHFHG